VLESDATTGLTLEPLDDWIVVEPLDDTETASGLIVPINEGTQVRTGIVAAVGPDVVTVEAGEKGILKREDLLARIHD
jgi:co-chaperonin GroES (HSP10)